MSQLNELSDLIKKRQENLEKILKSPLEKRFPFVENTTFVVARRWNSWYPSFFNVEGGCYFIVPARRKDQQQGNSLEIIVIDPGLRFISVLTSMGINVADIRKVVITHLHPDHMGGFLELASLIHTLGIKEKVEIIANITSKECLEKYYDYPIKLISERNLTPRYERSDGFFEQISLVPFETIHHEASGGSASVGLRIELLTDRHGREEKKIVTILGDTSYNPAENKDFVDQLLLADLSILHVGSFQEKKETGKHLYIKGVDDLIEAFYAKWKEQKRKYVLRPLIILSEFGLEHATEKQLKNALCNNVNENIVDFSLWESKGMSPIIQITDYFKQKNAEWATVFPGDIGLEIAFEQEVKIILRDRTTMEKVDPMLIEPIYIDGEIKYQDSSKKMKEIEEFPTIVSEISEDYKRTPKPKFPLPFLNSFEGRIYYKVVGLRFQDPEKSIKMCDVAIELFPRYPLFYMMKSSVHQIRREYPEALNSINMAIGIDDGTPSYWIQKMRIYMEWGRDKDELDKIREDFKRKFPDFIKHKLLYARTTDYTIKMSRLNDVFVVEPDNEEAKQIMGESYDF